MSKIYNFSEFSRIFESSGTGLNIIIGDSQTPYIANQSKNIRMLSKKGSKASLWLGGMGLSWLKDAVKAYPSDPNVLNVVICIGTNGGFNPKEDISGLFVELRRAFPKAKFYVVQGSWGWGGNKNITPEKVKQYYLKFSEQGAVIIEPPIGRVSDPHGNLPIYKEIGKAIDSYITEKSSEPKFLSASSGSGTLGSKSNLPGQGEMPPSVEDFQDWLDANKPGWAWGYPGGIVNKTGGYGKFGPRTTKAWTDFKDEYLSIKGTSPLDKKDVVIISQKPIGNFGKFTSSSNQQAPLIFVYGGIKVGGRESGDYMYDYLKNLQNKSSLFVAKNPSISGPGSFESVLTKAKEESLSPNKKILYLFSGGYLPGKAILEKYGADFFNKIYLVDIWMGNSSVSEFYKNLAFKYPNKIEYYYTPSGSANPSAAKEIASKVGVSKKVESSRGQSSTHMATNLDAVESLEKFIR